MVELNMKMSKNEREIRALETELTRRGYLVCLELDRCGKYYLRVGYK